MTGIQTFPLVAKQDKADEAGRNVIKLAVTKEAKAALTELADRYGMKEYVVASAIYLWFMAQDDIFQRAVLGMLEGLEVDAARAFMERWGKGRGKRFRTVNTGPLKPAANGGTESGGPRESPGPERPAGRQGKGRT